jgi:hypothetical protein
LRVAWTLSDLFNARTGFAHPSNEYIARESGLTLRNVQKALADLEANGTIVRITMVRPNGQKQRAIYPAGTSTVDVRGDVHQVDTQNLRRIPRVPKREYERARRAAEMNEQRRTERASREAVNGAPPALPSWHTPTIEPVYVMTAIDPSSRH